ncbi:MAG TPA: hypothetical protein VFY93_07065 [Planctomycetota bacterium]|nr:hypothetical protein [Planctomycetota bacterium]
MSALVVLLLVLAPPVAREPVGGSDLGQTTDPLERRVASLLAGEPIRVGAVSIVPLHARVPSEAGRGSPATILWADNRLVARFLEEDGESYLRVVNPSPDTILLAAGTVFARGNAEVAVARDVVIPGDFAAIVPAAALRAAGPATDLVRIGRIPPRATGSLLAGLPAFRGALAGISALRGENLLVTALKSGPVQARRNALANACVPEMEGAWGTAVGAIFLVADRPVSAHVFARHDVFMAALQDLLLGVSLEAREEEARRGRAQPGEAPVDVRGRALGWLRALLRADVSWSESYGEGFETLAASPTRSAVVHAVVDGQGVLVHAGFHGAVPIPLAVKAGGPPIPPPDPPGNPDETPGFQRRARPTVADQRRAETNPNPNPGPGPDAGPGGGRPR